MSEIDQIKKQLIDLKIEVRGGFQEFRDWRTQVNIARSGQEQDGIWGYKQKIDYNRRRISEVETKLEPRVARLEMQAARAMGFALGIGSVGGAASAIIFNLVLSVIS